MTIEIGHDTPHIDVQDSVFGIAKKHLFAAHIKSTSAFRNIIVRREKEFLRSGKSFTRTANILSPLRSRKDSHPLPPIPTESDPDSEFYSVDNTSSSDFTCALTVVPPTDSENDSEQDEELRGRPPSVPPKSLGHSKRYYVGLRGLTPSPSRGGVIDNNDIDGTATTSSEGSSCSYSNDSLSRSSSSNENHDSASLSSYPASNISLSLHGSSDSGSLPRSKDSRCSKQWRNSKRRSTPPPLRHGLRRVERRLPDTPREAIILVQQRNGSSRQLVEEPLPLEGSGWVEADDRSGMSFYGYMPFNAIHDSEAP